MAKATDTTQETKPEEPTLTVAQMMQAWEPINTFFQKFADLGALLRGVQSLDQQAGESLRRRDVAIEIGDAAEKATEEKLAMFQAKITRAQEESGRILAKANEDADTTRANAERDAEALLGPARIDLATARNLESAAKARVAELETSIAEGEKELIQLTKTIEAAQAKIAEFSKQG